MPIIDCPIEGCGYATADVEAAVAAALLMVHNNVHTAAAPTLAKQRAPKIERPNISRGSSEETWNSFNARWQLFKQGTALTPVETVRQLFGCCDEDLGNDLLRGSNIDIAATTEGVLLGLIKRLAVIPVAVSVRRSDLLSIKQRDGESARSFYARIKGKAATCAYSIECTSANCTQRVDFTDVIAKDVMISGLSDDEVKREVLGWHDLDDKTAEETVTYVEAKEMARDALNKHSSCTNAAISSYKKRNPYNNGQATAKTKCRECHGEMDKLSWSRREKRMVERSLCLSCWVKNNKAKNKSFNRRDSGAGENSAIAIGSISQSSNPIMLDHLIFDTDDGWHKVRSVSHPTLQLIVGVSAEDYACFDRKPPSVEPSKLTVVTDTGAQSCLWGRNDFLQHGFSKSDLIPVKHTLYAANRERISVDGAILLRLTGTTNNGDTCTAAVMTYVSPSANQFYLSRDALIQLNVISKDFPRVGAAIREESVDGGAKHVIASLEHSCECPARTLPPQRPSELPFPCIQENNEKMRGWLLDRFSTSTFNQCTHQQLPGMTGPAISLHVDPNATPSAVHTPAHVPLHWQDVVKDQLDSDVNLGVLEKVPIGEPSPWCHRMVLARKADGTPRRTVDLSPLNIHCLRETHHVKPPFQQAKTVPSNTWKSVTDAWNGFHSVPIRPEDRHFTTFITPWGRYRYRMAPQGFLASGDGYARRFDEIIADIERKTKCVDDTLMWDTDLKEHWWRLLDFLELLGHNGIILNKKKFQFAQKEVDFAGFNITGTEIKPLRRFLDAIEEFPSPTKTTDVRSWFGLVNQAAHYDQLSDIMAPFKSLLSPNNKFVWTEQHDEAFNQSKEAVINAIRKGVEIFDPERRTCLRPDWSKTGIGFFLSQKHCACRQLSPGCCNGGWKITLAGSRFLKPAETRYAPVEGEALAITWALEQTRYFTQGCDNLLIVTDHKPLVKLFGDRTLDEIANPRLFRLKQRTLMWRFTVEHQPGKENHFSDATSRNPSSHHDDDDDISDTLALDCIRISEQDHDDMECQLISIATNTTSDIRSITWGLVKQHSIHDKCIQDLVHLIGVGFPDDKLAMPTNISKFWDHRQHLYVIDGVVMMKQRIVIPQSLRKEIRESLHAAHQGVSSMNERAKQTVYWPGITNDIQSTRDNCSHCNRIAPSQSRLPPTEPHIPTTPFEAICCDYFYYKGWYYLVIADRLSGWTEQVRIRQSTTDTGSIGLCKALRSIFSTFGVPMELASDGGPEFAAAATTEFLQRWGIRHRTSSSYLPSSNGRAELAVKATKRLLMDNVDCNGNLNNDKMVRALLMQRNTPDPGCKLSPAEVLFGRPLRDTLPYIRKDMIAFQNHQFSRRWMEAWRLKEESLKTRYVKSMEKLNEHARPLPPLAVGTPVFIQNQTGQFPTRWDRSGTVVEVKNHNQYVIKVAGTGRLTLRNRQFLRSYKPHLLFSSEPALPSQRLQYSEPALPSQRLQYSETPDAATTSSASPATVPTDLHPTSQPTLPDLITAPHKEAPPSQAEPASTYDTPTTTTPVCHQEVKPPSSINPPTPETDNPRHFTQPPQPRRSTRQRTPTKVYDPQSGKYVPREP